MPLMCRIIDGGHIDVIQQGMKHSQVVQNPEYVQVLTQAIGPVLEAYFTGRLEVGCAGGAFLLCCSKCATHL